MRLVRWILTIVRNSGFGDETVRRRPFFEPDPRRACHALPPELPAQAGIQKVCAGGS